MCVCVLCVVCVCKWLMVHMGGESWYHQRSLSSIPSSQGLACQTSSCTYIYTYFL